MSKDKVELDDVGKYLWWCPGCEIFHFFQLAPQTPAWTWNNDFNKPTIQPSILVRSGNESGPTICHTFITDGKIQYLGDCTHKLAGQTVDMVGVDDV